VCVCIKSFLILNTKGTKHLNDNYQDNNVCIFFFSNCTCRQYIGGVTTIVILSCLNHRPLFCVMNLDNHVLQLLMVTVIFVEQLALSP